MPVVGIVGSGPINSLPNLKFYEPEVDIWIGADEGALTLIDSEITVDYAVGDFDSVTAEQKAKILEQALHSEVYSRMKSETDLEIALNKSYDLQAEKIYFFGLTGGRLDHGLVNVQLLYSVIKKNVRGIIIDKWNRLELKKPGTHTILKNKLYTYTSFIPFTEYVTNITLTGFVYPLKGYDVTWGSTRLISNELISEAGLLSFEEGLLLVIQSSDQC